ncbi:MAG: hypothetical protein ACE5NP_00305 [Anaerolineae bacterium]
MVRIAQESDLAIRILRLEQQLESYQKLHAEELDEIRKTLAELKDQILTTNSEDSDADAGIEENAGETSAQADGIPDSGKD